MIENSPRGADDIASAKRALRISAIASRGLLDLVHRQQAALQVAQTGIGFAAPPAGCTVSGFMAMGTEIDPAPLLARLHSDGFRICLPVVQPKGNPLVFRSWTPGERLIPRTWGILEPTDTAPVAEPDVLVIPLLAFDRRGTRLGYGGGYYDRTLQALRARKPVIAIGLAYAEQEAASLPVDPYDQALDWVLTEQGPIRTGNRNPAST